MKTYYCLLSYEDSPETSLQLTLNPQEKNTLASDPARISYQLISHSCFLQVCRNVGLNDNLQLRSEILVNSLCCLQLSLHLHPQNVLLGKKKNLTDTTRLEDLPQLSTLCFASFSHQIQSDYPIIKQKPRGLLFEEFTWHQDICCGQKGDCVKLKNTRMLTFSSVSRLVLTSNTSRVMSHFHPT